MKNTNGLRIGSIDAGGKQAKVEEPYYYDSVDTPKGISLPFRTSQHEMIT